MTQPATIECPVCREATYPHNMATAVQWVVENGRKLGKTTRQLPYCAACQRKASSGNGDRTELKHRLAALYEVMLWGDAKDGDGEKKCTRCHTWKPITVFPWAGSTDVVFRRGSCYPCFVLGIGKVDSPKAGVTAPYDIALAQIETRSGLPIARWTQTLHEAHCLLMRDLCHLPHHQRLDEERNLLPSRPRDEARWVRKLNAVKLWLNSSTSSASVSSPSNSGLIS